MLTVEGQSEDVSADRLSSSLSSHQSVHCCCTSHTCHSAVELRKTFWFFQSKKVFFKKSRHLWVCWGLSSTAVHGRPSWCRLSTVPSGCRHTHVSAFTGKHRNSQFEVLIQDLESEPVTADSGSVLDLVPVTLPRSLVPVWSGPGSEDTFFSTVVWWNGLIWSRDDDDRYFRLTGGQRSQVHPVESRRF